MHETFCKKAKDGASHVHGALNEPDIFTFRRAVMARPFQNLDTFRVWKAAITLAPTCRLIVVCLQDEH